MRRRESSTWCGGHAISYKESKYAKHILLHMHKSGAVLRNYIHRREQHEYFSQPKAITV